MAAIVLSPPSGAAIFKRFTLTSGAVVRPDFAAGGKVTVSERDAYELEWEGWTREPALREAPVFQKRAQGVDLATLEKHSPTLAKAIDDFLNRLEQLEARLVKMQAQWPVQGYHFVNGAQHRGVAGADLSAARVRQSDDANPLDHLGKRGFLG
jgi:hypothetical protein